MRLEGLATQEVCHVTHYNAEYKSEQGPVGQKDAIRVDVTHSRGNE